MTITASLVSKLREKTGVGMMDCKKALTETNGDFEAAIDWLRKKGIATASKKSDRVTTEGLIATLVEGKIGAILELNSETDFVAKNDKFQTLARGLVKDYIKFSANFDAYKESTYSATGKNIAEEIAEHIAVIGENITLRRAVKISVGQGVIGSYLHNAVAEGLGKIGVLVGLESEAPSEKLQLLGKQIAMHIAAAKPESVSVAELNQDLLSRERQILAEQAKASGKPDNVVEKMVEGRLTKFYEQVVLLEQLFVIDGKTRISELLKIFAKENNSDVKITGFVRYALGEGIEKKESNFAQEVAIARG